VESKAICRKLAKSFEVYLPQPSAILHGIETDALLICDGIPNALSFGNDLVAA
jgi:hypothetical protein